MNELHLLTIILGIVSGLILVSSLFSGQSGEWGETISRNQSQNRNLTWGIITILCVIVFYLTK